MPTRTSLALAGAFAALAATAPSAHADLQFRTLTAKISIVHEARSAEGAATVRIRTRRFRSGVVIYRGEGTPPPVQISHSDAGRWPGTLTGPGCKTKRVRPVLRLLVEGEVERLVVATGSLRGLRGFCGTPDEYGRDVLPSTPVKRGPATLRHLKVGRAATLRGVQRTGSCPEDCSTTRVTVRLRRLD